MESKEEKYIRAAERVRTIRKYYGKLVSYAIAFILFLSLNYYIDQLNNPWFLWIVGFWGLGLLIEGFKIFGTNMLFGKGWEERKIKEQMEKEESESENTNWTLRK